MNATTIRSAALLGFFSMFGATLGGCAVAAAGPGVTENAPATSAASAASATGRVGSHGMVLVGTPNEAFLSHIPMFGAPHDVQLIVAGSFTMLEAGPSLPSSFSDASFTFLPDTMSLDALRTGVLTELQGKIFLGNFEQGGRPIPTRVRFAVSRVVQQHILDPNAAPAAELGYILFASRSRTFAAHKIAASPSFDEVLHVELEGEDAPSDAELASGVSAGVASSSDTLAMRIGDRASAATVSTTASAGATRRSFTLKSTTSLSCLVGPDFFNPCP